MIKSDRTNKSEDQEDAFSKKDKIKKKFLLKL